MGKKGADATIAEAQGFTPVHGAAFQGRANIAKILLDHGCPLRGKHGGDGFEPAARSCWGGDRRHTETLKFFLDNGVPVEDIYDECMEKSENQGSISILKRFKKMKEKADEMKTKTEESKAAKTEECKADETGECKAAKTEEPKAAKTFDPNEVDPVYAEAFKELGAAFKDEDFLKAEMVLKKYEGMLDINSQSPREGQTLLMQSVLHGKEKCVEYLLKRGADVNIAEAKGYTPMHGAAFQGRANIARCYLTMAVHYVLNTKEMVMSQLFVPVGVAMRDMWKHLNSSLIMEYRLMVSMMCVWKEQRTRRLLTLLTNTKQSKVVKEMM